MTKRNLIIWVISWLAVLLAFELLANNFFHIFLYLLAYLGILISGLLFLLALFIKKQRLFSLVLLIFFISPIVILNLKITTSQANAEKIILALEQYKNTRGAYPCSLIDLEPDYFKNIPKPNIALLFPSNFQYFGSDSYNPDVVCKGRENYTILFPLVGWSTMYYYSLDKEWRVDRK